MGKIFSPSSRSYCFSCSDSSAYGVSICRCQRTLNSAEINIPPLILSDSHLSKRYSIHRAHDACSLSASCSINSCLFISLPSFLAQVSFLPFPISPAHTARKAFELLPSTQGQDEHYSLQ